MRTRYTRWRKRAITIWWPWHRYPTVYVPKSRVTDPLRMERTMAHEAVHVLQWLQLKRFRFLRRYITRKGRLRLEAEAFAASCEWWWNHGYTTIDRGGVLVPVMQYYAESLSKYYGLRYSVARCKEAIESWLDFTQSHNS